ncbi:MAG: hypothetical protein HZC37_07145 [Burkholderiales bacterium]|nr:hypothetical protein [Burkholderiales bacterium]
MKTAFVIAAALLWPLVATAQGAWPQQPTDVMGIRLGAPLDGAGIQPCDASNEYRGRLSTSVFCYQPRAALGRPDRTFFTVHNSPDLGTGGQRVVLDVAFGHVAGILLTGNAIRFDKMLAVLETRYGTATETAVGKARFGDGAEFATVTKRWRGDRVTIEATSPFGRADEFTVYWSDLATQARRDAQSARESKSGASKL